MAGDQQHIHDPAKAEEFARAVGLQIGGAGHPFVGDWATKGLYAYKSGKYSGIAYFGRGGSERDRLAIPHESDKYRPWNRYDPDIPAHIRDKLVKLEDDDSTSIGQPPQPARTQPSTTPLSRDMPRGENILVSEHSLPKYNGIYTIQNTEINGKPWFKNNSGCILYFYNANSGGGPSWSLDDRSQDGTNDWFRGGWIEPPNSGGPPLGTRSWAILETHRRFEIKLESVSIPHEDSRDVTPLKTGWYRMEHADGSLIERVRVHRDERNTSATNEFIATGDHTGDVLWYLEGNTVIVPKFNSTGIIQADGNIIWGRDGNKAIYEGNAGDHSIWNQSIRNDVGKIALKSVHGKYLSAQPDGRAEWNRVKACAWEFFELGERDGRKITLRSAHGKFVSAQPDGTVQINRNHAPSGGWEEFTVETRPGPTPGDSHDFLHLKSVHEKYLSAQADGTVQWNRDHASPGGWEDIQFVPQVTHNQEQAPIKQQESIEILEAVTGKPIRFKLNSPPNHNDAWVGIYPPNASDHEHGEQGTRWHWIRDIDVNNASLTAQSEGNWSIRVFSDGGFTLHYREDFEIESIPFGEQLKIKQEIQEKKEEISEQIKEKMEEVEEKLPEEIKATESFQEMKSTVENTVESLDEKANQAIEEVILESTEQMEQVQEKVLLSLEDSLSKLNDTLERLDKALMTKDRENIISELSGSQMNLNLTVDRIDNTIGYGIDEALRGGKTIVGNIEGIPHSVSIKFPESMNDFTSGLEKGQTIEQKVTLSTFNSVRKMLEFVIDK